jgi:uncharacterized protein (TIGR03437 family)
MPLLLTIFAAGAFAQTTTPVYTADSIANSAASIAGYYAPNTFVMIYGKNLAYVTKAITTEDIRGGILPTVLIGTGVRVLMNNIPAVIYYVSPGQVNLLVPTLLTAGPRTGQVLIAGGSNSASAELYNPATGMFTTTGDMTVARTGHTATALAAQDGAQNGDVLIVGTNGSADLYDPTKGTFARIGSLLPGTQPGHAHTVNLRSDGTVLAAGGYDFRGSRGVVCPVSGTAAALFAPESDGFTATGSLGTKRDSHTATVLADGTVLIVGGTEHRGCLTGAVVLSSAELFK